MLMAPIPSDEQERLADLQASSLLDTPPEKRFDQLVELARDIFQVPITYIALLDQLDRPSSVAPDASATKLHHERLDLITHQIRRHQGSFHFQDDYSLMELCFT